jgi:capsular polysaccharide transport system ATP-binding protein
MIELVGVSKTYPTRHGPVRVLDDVSMKVARGEKLGILGRNGAGKSTLIRMISGAEAPSKGTVVRSMNVSWPIAFGGAFQSSLTGLDNYRFICRIYGADHRRNLEFLREFTELGRYLDEPVKSYSTGMRARLAFAISMAIEFDCFLIDEVVAVGDSRFHEKCLHELFEKRHDRALIIVSHDQGYISRYCDRAAVLSAGKLQLFNNVDDAYHQYQT